MIDGGKKEKVRPGDIVGALQTGELGLSFDQLGKINMLPMVSFVAVRNDVASCRIKTLKRRKNQRPSVPLPFCLTDQKYEKGRVLYPPVSNSDPMPFSLVPTCLMTPRCNIHKNIVVQMDGPGQATAPTQKVSDVRGKISRMH